LGSYSHPDPRGNSSTASASIGFRDSGTGSTISVAGDFNGLAVARPLRTWDMTASSCVTCCVALSAEFSVQSFVPQVAERGVPFVRMEIETFARKAHVTIGTGLKTSLFCGWATWVANRCLQLSAPARSGGICQESQRRASPIDSKWLPVTIGESVRLSVLWRAS